MRRSVRPRHLPPGGTWNNGTARCDCNDGYERSEDGQSCECATDDAEQTGHVASVLFPNPQSLFDGLRVGFVNTSSGNLTFLRRDIVTRAQGPVVFARAYDSRIAADADFGPGWRLSLAEELLIDGDAATYIDEAGAQHAFAWTGMGWTASPPTPRHAATTLDFADVDGIRVAVLADGGTVRTFEQADAVGARYVVRLVRTPARELVFDYDGGRLRTVSHDGGTLFDIERDRDGRIAALRDDHGRSVHYAYDADGRLETVRDIAGSDWRYRYRDDGLLGGAVDPDDRTYLAADYDAAGRAVRAFGGRLHDYAYAPEGTTVAEATGEVHALTRNAAGVTTALSSTTGDSWSLTLDGANRVSTLTLPGRTIAYAYGGHGKVATMTVADSVSGTTRMHSYDYDAQGRLVAVTGGGADATVVYAAGLVRIDDGGGVFEYEVDDRARVAGVRQGADPEVRVERDGAGDVVEISQGHRNVRFGRDELGRIVDAVFADGGSARYFYDELGSRRLTEHDDGRIVEYARNAAGNLTSVETTARDGTLRLETVSTSTGVVTGLEHGAVERSGVLDERQEPLPVDDRDNRALATPSGESSRFEWHGHTEDGARVTKATTDTRLAVLMGDGKLRSQPDYGVLSFGRHLEAVSRNPEDSRIPRLTDAHALLPEAQWLLRGAVALQFDGQSNAVFRSALLRGDDFAHTASQSESSTTCEPCDPPAYDEIAGAAGVSYQVRNYQHKTPTATNWGEFHTDGRIGLDVAIQAYYVASSRVWKPKVVAATSRYDIWWGHTVSEATAANATASNCSQMILDLTQGNPVLQYYSTEALQAHEYGHLADWETTMNQEFPAAVQTIEALSVPHSCGMSQSAAEVALTGLPGFKPARDAALRTALNTFMSFRELNADAAGQAVADRIIREIKAKGDQNASWPQACRK